MSDPGFVYQACEYVKCLSTALNEQRNQIKASWPRRGHQISKYHFHCASFVPKIGI